MSEDVSDRIIREEALQDQIEKFMDTEIRPFVQEDGGDVELLSFNLDTGVARIMMQGACSTCPSSIMTLQFGIERRLREAFPEITRVEAAGGLFPGLEPEN